MNLPSPKVCRRIHQLHAMMGSPNANESAAARDKLVKLLTKHGLTWNDLPAILASIEPAPAKPASGPVDPPPQNINVFDLVAVLLETYSSTTPEERTAIALWALHAHVFGGFMHTPRLALLSPVRGCGKSRVMKLLRLLCPDPYRASSITPAAIYNELATRERTLLIDEGDNLGLLNNPLLRQVFNDGYEPDGCIGRFIGGRSRTFPLFAPLAVAAIGMLPLPLMSRSIIVNMQRAPMELPLLNEKDPGTLAQFTESRKLIERWAANCVLEHNPPIPELIHRGADNVRVLLSIADNLGRGEDARAALLALYKDRPDEDAVVLLLIDIRRVLDSLGVDRITSAALIAALLELEDSIWSEWRGPHDDRPARKLSQPELSRLLRPLGIKPRSVWPAARGPGSKSSKGYYRHQFESAWASYCSPAGTSAQSNKIKRLA
jgi:hypothetical protein